MKDAGRNVRLDFLLYLFTGDSLPVNLPYYTHMLRINHCKIIVSIAGWLYSFLAMRAVCPLGQMFSWPFSYSENNQLNKWENLK